MPSKYDDASDSVPEAPNYDNEKYAFDNKITTVPIVQRVDAEDDFERGSVDGIKIDVHTNIKDGLQRQMHQRHVQMIALAGTLGTGLFLSSGKAIIHAGPAGALIAYILVGTVVWSMIQSLVCPLSLFVALLDTAY